MSFGLENGMPAQRKREQDGRRLSYTQSHTRGAISKGGREDLRVVSSLPGKGSQDGSSLTRLHAVREHFPRLQEDID